MLCLEPEVVLVLFDFCPWFDLLNLPESWEVILAPKIELWSRRVPCEWTELTQGLNRLRGVLTSQIFLSVRVHDLLLALGTLALLTEVGALVILTAI